MAEEDTNVSLELADDKNPVVDAVAEDTARLLLEVTSLKTTRRWATWRCEHDAPFSTKSLYDMAERCYSDRSGRHDSPPLSAVAGSP